MKTSILCLSLLFATTFGLAQVEIPNGNFEEWGLFNTWNYSPAEWNTPNMQLLAPVEMDSMAYEGDFAMRVTPFLGFETSSTTAHTSFVVNELPEQLSFWVKAFIDEGEADSVRVSLSYFESDAAQSPLYNITWIATTSIDDWTLVTLDLDTDIVGATMASVAVRCGYDGALGGGPWSTWISVDAMAVGASTGMADDDLCLQPTELSIRGNIITAKGCGFATNKTAIELYDLSGKLLARKEGNSMKLDQFAEGLYMARAYSEGVPVTTRKFVLR
jgi:hypothetical protein